MSHKDDNLNLAHKEYENWFVLRARLKSIMLQNLPIMLSGISFFLPIIPKIMLTAPIILQIVLIYLHIIVP